MTHGWYTSRRHRDAPTHFFYWGVEKAQTLLREHDEDYNIHDLPHILCQSSEEFTQRSETFYTPNVFGNNGPVVFTRQNQFSDGWKTGYCSRAGRRLLPPREPDMKDYSKRRRTLDVLPDFLKAELSDLDSIANSGFYHTATCGFRCYYCGFGGFTPGYDPWILHAKHTDCCHVILTKGESYIEQANNACAKLQTGNAAGSLRRHSSDLSGKENGVMTRSMTKKRREVFVRKEEQNYQRTCSTCKQTSTVTGALETSVQMDYLCADCRQGTSGHT